MGDLVVWHVFGTMDVGGAELRTMELGDALALRGIRFEYVTLSGRPGHLDQRIEAGNGKVHPLPLSPLFPLRFVQAVRRYRPDVLDSHVATFSGLLLAMAWVARVPVRIAHFRSDGDGHSDSLRRRLQRRVMSFLIATFATDIVGVSPSSLSDGYRTDWALDRRARVIPNGLGPKIPDSRQTLRADLGMARSSTLLMHVGRPSPEKNRPLAVRVLAEARRGGVDAHLVLVGGEGADAADVTETIREMGVEPYVHEIGRRLDTRHLMRQADALVLTSHREGLPGVVLESLSMGTPVVSVPLPGVLYIRSMLPGVEVVEDDLLETWTLSILRATSTGATERSAIADAFEGSPFTITRASHDHEKIYRSAGMRG